ncbi:MAG: S16 family serine protease, partial [Candidatus Sumerlaeota bacterium]
GVRDEAEIRGHRRTYIGAMPGKIVQSMKKAGSINPVLLLDEIDKMSSDFRGDPAAALLEVLDPEQNKTFNDHYIDVDYDLSRVLFITTANTTQDIPLPLQDRMEIIRLSGYTELEKLEIAKRYLIPKAVKANGLKRAQFKMTKPGLAFLIQGYTREAGVRNLEREINSVCRKLATRLVTASDEKKAAPIPSITPDLLKELLGPERFRDTAVTREPEIGNAIGLAWTEVGGEVLHVESRTMPGKGQLLLTGKLGDVMKESANTALSYIRAHAAELGIDPEFSKNLDIHVHLPEGAIPKDGPSAGITLATSLASALAQKPVRQDLAMTGELTLRGKILKIGGLKEKVLAAHRYRIKHVLIPLENESDLHDIPDEVKKKMTFHMASTLMEVFEVAFGVKIPRSEKKKPEPSKRKPARRSHGRGASMMGG